MMDGPWLHGAHRLETPCPFAHSLSSNLAFLSWGHNAGEPCWGAMADQVSRMDPVPQYAQADPSCRPWEGQCQPC